jgi:hypothetical protein
VLVKYQRQSQAIGHSKRILPKMVSRTDFVHNARLLVDELDIGALVPQA